jgi:hypothetical protein
MGNAGANVNGMAEMLQAGQEQDRNQSVTGWSVPMD